MIVIGTTIAANNTRGIAIPSTPTLYKIPRDGIQSNDSTNCIAGVKLLNCIIMYKAPARGVSENTNAITRACSFVCVNNVSTAPIRGTKIMSDTIGIIIAPPQST